MTKNWEDNKERICHLYKDRGYTLEDVRKIMAEDHEFKASTRSYRDKLSQWNAYKFSTRRSSSPPTDSSRSSESSYESDTTSAGSLKLDFEPPNEPCFNLSTSPPSAFAPSVFTDSYSVYEQRLERRDRTCLCPYCPQHATRPTRTESNGSDTSIDVQTAAQALLDLKPSFFPSRQDSFPSIRSNRTSTWTSIY